MLGIGVLCRKFGEASFIVAGVPEANGESLARCVCQLGGEAEHEVGVDAARKEDACIAIDGQAAFHGLLQEALRLGNGVLEGEGNLGGEGGGPPGRGLRLCAWTEGHSVRAIDLIDVTVNGPWRGNVSQGKIVGKRLQIDSIGKCFEFGERLGEMEGMVVQAPVEGLLAV